MWKKGLFFFSFLLLGVGAFAQQLSLFCEDMKPLQFLGADGRLTGMAVELVREIQKRVGNQDEIQMVPWSRGLDALNSAANTALFSMARTADRNARYYWIGPTSEDVYGLYVKADSPIKIASLDDARKLDLIGVYRDRARLRQRDQFQEIDGRAVRHAGQLGERDQGQRGAGRVQGRGCQAGLCLHAQPGVHRHVQENRPVDPGQMEQGLG